MSNRDERGGYINDSDVRIVLSEYEGGIKVSFYDNSPEREHKSIHTHINENGTIKTEDNVNGKIEKSDIKCFLTTACLNHYKEKFDDNCEELAILRWFRDTYVLKEDINYYYSVAPIIVNKINQLSNNHLIYDFIYHNVVIACVQAIKNGDYQFAYYRYKNSVLALERQFVMLDKNDFDVNNKNVLTVNEKKLVKERGYYD